MRHLVLLLSLLALAACPASVRGERAAEDAAASASAPAAPVAPIATAAPERYEVYEDDLLVLGIVGEPGPLISTAPPPPGPAQFTRHPFLSATAASPLHEHQLRQLLKASTSVADYLAKLRAAGFTVKRLAPAAEKAP